MTHSVFDLFDQYRRWLGRQLDAFGLGPLETSFRIVATKPVMKLRCYPARHSGPVLLIVPAPIKQAYIWDLVPQASVVRRCVDAGFRVYLIQWQSSDASDHDLGLAAYTGELIQHCIEITRRQTGESIIFLAGHSLGGTLAAISTALHPNWVKGLILLGAPLHFGRNVGSIDDIIAVAPKAQALTALLGDVPGSFLSLTSSLVDPLTFGWLRWLDGLGSLTNREAMQMYARVERWTFEELPLPRRLFEEVVEYLYREDRFMQGTLTISGQRAAPEMVTAPLLSVVDPCCRLVPCDAVLPFHRAVQSTDKKVLWYQGDVGVSLQHVGMLVGKRAHTYIWPQVIRWIRSHWNT